MKTTVCEKKEVLSEAANGGLSIATHAWFMAKDFHFYFTDLFLILKQERKRSESY